MAGTGNTQIIGGQTYTMYTPAWYAALEAQKQAGAASDGTATGTALKAANTAAGLPPLDVSQSSSSSSSSGAGAVDYSSRPSVAGLGAAAFGAAGGQANPNSAATAHLAPVNTDAAQAAAFAKAKDTEGLNATGALTGLRSALGGRSMLGGGTESRATAGVVNASAGRLGDVSREQAVTKANLENTNATTNLGAEVTQRGQDYQHEEAGNSLAADMATADYQGKIQQRGQDIQAQSAANAMKIEQAQLASQQRASALEGLTAALKVTAPMQSQGAY